MSGSTAGYAAGCRSVCLITQPDTQVYLILVRRTGDGPTAWRAMDRPIWKRINHAGIRQDDQMNSRRHFLKALGGALAWPRFALAQPAERTYRVGWLSSGPRTEPYNVAFEQRLRELGFAEGRNLVIEFRTAQGRIERLPDLAADLARQNCDVLLAPETEANLAAIKQASRDTPIVMVAIDYDPVATGHIASLVRPGGRITGMTHIQSELPAKRVELLKELLPSARENRRPRRYLQHRPTGVRRGRRKAPGRGATGAPNAHRMTTTALSPKQYVPKRRRCWRSVQPISYLRAGRSRSWR
jgi:hypothetical protein